MKKITPTQIVLVHGDPSKMGELRKELMKQFCSPSVGSLQRLAPNVLTPKNCEPISFSFKTHLKAEAVGTLAKQLAQHLLSDKNSIPREPMADIERGNESEEEMHNYVRASGIITKKGSDIRVMKREDVPKYTYLQPWYCS